MSHTDKSFRKGDRVIKAGVWSNGEGRPEHGPHIPSIVIYDAAPLGAMGKKQGFVLIGKDRTARERIYASQLGHGIFHEADEAVAIAFAREQLRETLEHQLRFAERSEHVFGAALERHQDRVIGKVWETCPIERRPWLYS